MRPRATPRGRRQPPAADGRYPRSCARSCRCRLLLLLRRHSLPTRLHQQCTCRVQPARASSASGALLPGRVPSVRDRVHALGGTVSSADQGSPPGNPRVSYRRWSAVRSRTSCRCRSCSADSTRTTESLSFEGVRPDEARRAPGHDAREIQPARRRLDAGPCPNRVPVKRTREPSTRTAASPPASMEPP